MASDILTFDFVGLQERNGIIAGAEMTTTELNREWKTQPLIPKWQCATSWISGKRAVASHTLTVSVKLRAVSLVASSWWSAVVDVRASTISNWIRESLRATLSASGPFSEWKTMPDAICTLGSCSTEICGNWTCRGGQRPSRHGRNMKGNRCRRSMTNFSLIKIRWRSNGGVATHDPAKGTSAEWRVPNGVRVLGAPSLHSTISRKALWITLRMQLDAVLLLQYVPCFEATKMCTNIFENSFIFLECQLCWSLLTL